MVIFSHQNPAILLQQTLNIPTQQKHNKKKELKTNFIKLIEVLKEEMNIFLKEIWEIIRGNDKIH